MFTLSDRQFIKDHQVCLVAVTKNHSVDDCLAMIQNLQPDAVAESKWQEAQSKIAQLSNDLDKHFIGHVQSNKAKYIAELFDVVQSVDSVRIAEALNNEAGKLQKQLKIFLQVNVSQDKNKYGFSTDELAMTLDRIRSTCHQLEVMGLMTITARQDDEETRKDFQTMKRLQSELKLPQLSMGMSGDWRTAIEEGATMIRIGSALF